MDRGNSAVLDSKQMSRVSRQLVPVHRAALDAIPVTERGDRSDRWSGVQHGVLANTVLEQANRRGLDITREEWKVSEDGSRLFGDLWIANDSSALSIAARDVGITRGYGGFNPEVMGLRLGVLSANDSSFAIALIVVARVKVCSNGLTVEGGHITCKRKHTTGVHEELPGVISAGLDTYVNRVGLLGQTQSQLTELDFSRQIDVDHALVEAGRRGLFPWSKLGLVEEEWRNPRHPEFADRTGWSLVNCFSEVAKRFNPVREIQVVEGARQLVLETAPNLN